MPLKMQVNQPCLHGHAWPMQPTTFTNAAFLQDFLNLGLNCAQCSAASGLWKVKMVASTKIKRFYFNHSMLTKICLNTA
jgi:hypothetical protein